MQADNLTDNQLEHAAWRSRVVGRARTIGNRVSLKRASRVRISPSPPKKADEFQKKFVSFLFAPSKGIAARHFIEGRRTAGNQNG
jgi:hypothetical protein